MTNILKYKNTLILLCIITIFFLLNLIFVFIEHNHKIISYILKLWEIDYDPLDLIIQNKENNKNKIYIKITNYRAPIFRIDLWYLVGKGLNTWSNVFDYHNLFINELEKNIISNAQYWKKNNEMEYFIYNENIPTNKAFLKHHFKNEKLIDKIIYQENVYDTARNIHLVPSDPFFKFPERNSRMNKLEYTLNNFPHSYEWSTSSHSFGNDYLTGVSNRFYNNYEQSIIDFDNKSKYSRILEIETYFKHYDKKFTEYIQEKYKNKNLIYHISKAQINHLMQLNYQEIQYILHLIQDTTYFKDRTFIDVHWEIFNGNSYLSGEKINIKKKTLSTLSQNHYMTFLNIKNILQNWINKLILANYNLTFLDWLTIETKTSVGFFNPFHMNFPGIIELNKTQRKYYFTEESLCLIPIHILTKINNHILVDELFITNIYEQSKSNNFWNLLSNSGNTFVERLFKYTEYGKYSPTTIIFFSDNSEHIETPYEKIFFLSHNPWWESLAPSTQVKINNLFKLEEKELNNIFLKLIDHFFEKKPFLTNEEIENLLPKIEEEITLV